ncbi:cation channel sperm-associated auxiliary subunit delta [Trichechus manatus latirostris]|uniref:Cation channel sperm-associated auxiliary subunit delta n=1 Tax=Trichechus manatus latirostris TaxID=127582 RepID=A0A2Y9RAF6_TRIMA|nr:cation channel sperm-associated auxiliary subunit delta [Trichechus manatus latirostris]
MTALNNNVSVSGRRGHTVSSDSQGALITPKTLRVGTLELVQRRPDKEDILYFSSRTTSLITHPCKRNLAVYLGARVFFTTDSFGSSLLPFTIPTSMQVGVPAVTSAHFAGPVLLFVINQKVYIYDYQTNSWNAAIGIEHPISHISGDNCCYSQNSFCLDIGDSIFAYLYGEMVSQANIYYSKTFGYSFQKFAFYRQEELVGSLGGIFFFHSLSQVGLLVLDGTTAKFVYSDHPLSRSFGLPFDYVGTLDVLITPGQKGILILWSDNNLLISPNAGQLINTVMVNFRPYKFFSSILEANLTLHSIATNENELAILARNDSVYYGSLSTLSSSVIRLSNQRVWSQEAALMFTHLGELEILTPLPDVNFPAFDFLRCPINIQEILMNPDLEIEACKVQRLHGFFGNKMYTIDMNSELTLTAFMVPRLGNSPIPLVTVSNPHSLGLQATIEEQGYTLDGNSKYQLNIYLKQQHHSGRADPNFTSSIKRPTMSTVTLDIANKEISCIDLKPLTALVSVGCDLEKKIIVQNDLSACSKGILDPVTLQDNYYYIIEKEAYDPNFLGQKATEDLKVLYQYNKLGCPSLVYYDTPWKPVVELWRRGKFQEVVNAQYVLLEVNGLFTYTYSLTAGTALCKSQPQNWTTIMADAGYHRPFSWDRENYVSCHKPNGGSLLRWPDVPYQIMGGPTNNKIIFEQRNGIYVFLLSIVDPYYSYCHLETTFSIYVYGDFPPSIIPIELTIILLTMGMLLTLWLVYAIPKCHAPR